MIRSLCACEEWCFRIADRLVPRYAPELRKRARFFRYLAAGGTAAFVDLGLLYLLTESFGLHYLFSAILAFIVAFFVSFFLQKFWTFQDNSVEKVHTQVAVYFITAIASLALNTLLMYLFVEWLHLWYMSAQFLASGLLACVTFFISRDFIFSRRASV
jgi:putative flippase GtrA